MKHYGKNILIIIGIMLVLAGCEENGMIDISGNSFTAEESENLSGAVADRSDKDAPKAIESTDLESFRVVFQEDYFIMASGKEAKSGSLVYPSGRYSFEMKKKNYSASVSADFAGDAFEFDADENDMGLLDALLKENGIPGMNGHDQVNSALGTYIDLQARYSDGEQIIIHAEGGASVLPTGWDGNIFIKFFDNLMEERLGSSYGKSLITDNSDSSAVKTMPESPIIEMYIEFDPPYDNDKRDGFAYGRYRIQYKNGALPYSGIDTNCAVWRGSDVISSFDISSDDIEMFTDWINENEFCSCNGWNKKSTVDAGQFLKMHIYYEDGAKLSIEGQGISALPENWDAIQLLKMLQAMAESHGVHLN